MARSGDQPIAFSRLLELAEQAERQERCRFTPFLTPPEADLALAAAKRANVQVELFGGYEDAERRMARFCTPFNAPELFPIVALLATWPHQSAPEHRDLLGGLMGLGIQRARTGDILLQSDRAYLFVEAALAEMIRQTLLEAGRTHLMLTVTDTLPTVETPAGEAQHFTVLTPRLDAMIADGFHLSRGKAAELIEAGAVKLRHMPTLRPDARVAAGDTVSVRGYGRLSVEEIGEPTRKGRLPVQATRFGTLRK